MSDQHPRIGSYELVRELGRGGMAVIFLARQPALDRFVALKQLDLIRDERQVAERFLREARIAGRLDHPNVVTVHDFFEHDGRPYIAMEYLDRGSLRSFVSQPRRLPLAQVLGVLEGVLAGLAHAESHGIAHRDLKPENVLVTRRGGVKIADFGIAKAYTQVTARLTMTGMAVGTPVYMAPEQATAGPVGPRTDLYALGVMTYEMLAGEPPWGDVDTPFAMLYRKVHDVAPRLNVGDVDPRLADLVDRLLARDPDDRPGSAAETWERFEEVAVDLLGSYWRRRAALTDPTEAPAAGPGVVPPWRPDPTPAPTPRRVRSEPAAEAAEALAASAAAESHAPSGYVSFEPIPQVAPPAEPAPDDTPAAQPAPAGNDTSAPARGDTSAPARDDTSAPAPSPARDDTPAPAAAPARDDTPAVEPARVREEVTAPAPDLPTVAPRTVPVAAPERRGAPRRRLGYGMVAVVLAAAAALGLAAAPTVRRPVSVRLTSRVATDGLSAAVPAGWAKSSATLAALRSLGLQRAIAMAPATAGAGDGVLLGWGSTATPRLLPDSFLAAFGSPPHAGEVRLGTQSALAYGPMSGGGAEVTVYVVPTSRGDATVACRSRRAGEVRRACDAIAQSLQLTGVTVFAPAPRAAYARAVERALQRMQRDEARQARRLAGARTAAGQAAALRPFAGIYGRAAAALGAIRTAPFERGPTAAVVTQLHRLQGDYAALAAAAAAGRRGRYAQARGAAQTARRRLSAATTALGSLGYTLTKGAT